MSVKYHIGLPNMKDRLTKTAYLNYLKCPQEFWLDYNDPIIVKEAPTLEYEHLRQQGYAVQQLVKQLRRFEPTDSYDRGYGTSISDR